MAHCCTCAIRGRRGHTVSAEPGGHTSCLLLSQRSMKHVSTGGSSSRPSDGWSSERTDSAEAEDERRLKQNDVIWTPAAAVTDAARSPVNLQQQDTVVYCATTNISVTSHSSNSSGASSTSSTGSDTPYETPAVTRSSGIE